MEEKKLEQIIAETKNEKLLKEIFENGSYSESITALKNINDVNYLKDVLEKNCIENSSYKLVVVFKLLKTLLGEDFDISKYAQIFNNLAFGFDGWENISIVDLSELVEFEKEDLAKMLYGYLIKYKEIYNESSKGIIYLEFYCELKKAIASSSEYYTFKLLLEEKLNCLSCIRYMSDETFINLLNNKVGDIEGDIYSYINTRKKEEISEIVNKICETEGILETTFENLVEKVDNEKTRRILIEKCISKISDKQILKKLTASCESWYAKLLALAKLEERL